MDKITIITELYAAAREYGWTDTLRASAPDQTDPGYITWLVQTGSFRAIVFTPDFANAIAQYFHSKNVSDPVATDGTQLLMGMISAIDPINYLGAFLKEALLSDADFAGLMSAVKANLEEQTKREVILTLSEDQSTATFTLGSYTNSVSIEATTPLERYTKLVSALKDLSDQVLDALIQEGAKAFAG